MKIIIAVKDADNIIGLKEEIAMRLEGVADILRIDTADVVPKSEVEFWQDAAANAKKEAVKEFAEKLKKCAEVVTTLSDDETILAIQDHFVDEVAEEMMGGQNG